MAAAISPFFPFGVLSLCFLLALCNHANSISFDFVFNTTQTFSDAYLQRSGDAFFPTSEMIELTKNDRTGYINNSMGLVWYAQPVPLWSNATGELASFTTAFSFEIKIDDQSSTYEPGDGMTFFLTHYPPAPRNQTSSGGGDLGLFINGKNNLTGDFRAVAVEFDTYHNIQWNESQSQHIGIDINSIESVASTDTISPAVLVPSNSTSTVNYNSSTKLLAVDVSINGTLYHVNFTVDLREVLPEEVAVGFSASNGFSAEFHRVKNWSFSSTDLQQLQKTPARPEPSKKLLLMVLVPTIVLYAFAGLLLWLWKKPSRKLTRGGHSDSEDEQHNDGAELERGVIGPKRYHYRDLADATSDFAEERKLGRGGFGSVYRGLLRSDDQLPDGVPVAIKVFSSESSSQGRKEFEAEVRIISQLRHRNLVRLLGWCDSRKGLLLVYELEPEGSLDKHIYNSDRLLTWSERYKIILGLGSALSYLHQDWEQCIVHGDIKPSNIMLDTSYNTKLGDFGLARLVDHGTGPCTTNLIQGTAGYIDPEFVNTRQRSTQSDIYSFGIVLLEIVSGRQPVVNHEGVPPFMLLKWVWGLYRRNMTLDAADGRLRGGDGLYERQMERALVVGLWCAHPDLGQRPSIAQAMHVLQSEDAKLPALSLEMYIAPPLNLGVGGNGGGDNSSNFSSGVPSSATTGTTRSTGSFVN